jgi:predicted DNA-binding transcriptional regulator YafY
MPYERSLDIERRLSLLLSLIRAGAYSAPSLARELGVSIPTVSRDLTALRTRGFRITAERTTGKWRYLIASLPPKIPASKYVESAGPLIALNHASQTSDRKENRS